MQPDHDEITTPPCAVHNSRAPSPIAVGFRHAEVGPRGGERASTSCSPSRGAVFSPPLQRKTPLKRSGRLRRRSAKTAKVYREERVPFVREYVGGPCETCPIIQSVARMHRCRGFATEVHELKTRARGGSITDPANCVGTCDLGHRWIHENVALSAELGLLKHSWED